MKKRQSKHSLIWATCISFLLLLCQSIIYLFVKLFTNNDALLNLVTYILSITPLFIIFHEIIIRDIKNIKNDVNKNVKKITYFFLLFILLEIISNYIISNSLNTIAINEETNINTLHDNYFISIIYLALLGPICEEFMIKIPFKIADNNRLASFIVISIYFALLHIIGSSSVAELLYIIPYLFLSLGINYSYYKTNNICVASIFHIINNVLSITLTTILS